MDPTRGPEPPALNYGLKHYVRHTGPGAHASHRACRKTYLKIGESPPLFLGNISKPAVLERAPDWCEGKWKVWKLIKKVRAHIVRLRKRVGVLFNWRECPFVCAGKMHSFRHGDVWTRFQKWGERSVAFEKKKHCKTCGPWANHGMRVFWWCGFMDYQINLQSGFGTLTTQNGIKKAKQVGIDPPADDMSLFSLIYTGILYDALQSWGSEKCAANCVEKCSKLNRSRNLRVLKMRRGGLLKMIE